MLGWLTLAVGGAVAEQYFFLMQRSALEVCRARELPSAARFAMLPGHYQWGRLTSLAKWAGVVGLVVAGRWGVGLMVIAGSFLLSAVLPVPHAAFFKTFYRVLEKGEGESPSEDREALRQALTSVDREFGITNRGEV